MASTPPSSGSTSLGMAPNVLATLCYAPLCCLPLLASVVVVVAEKESRFARFHAFQSLLLHAAAIALAIAAQVLGVILGMISTALSLIVTLFMGLIGLGFFVLAIFLAIKAYNNEEYELPTLGQMARNWT
jgi:uncharacterized membrane protein